MKILKIFGIVVGIHVFALILIFANPGCSSTAKTPPAPAETAGKSEPPPAITPPGSSSSGYSSSSSAITFNPNAPAAAAQPSGEGMRSTPTRPGTPVANVLNTEPVGDVTPAASYTVKSGDSFSSIAKRHNLTISQLTAANNLSANAVLRPGQKLIIPSKQPAAAAAPAGPTPAPKGADAAPAPAAARPSGDVVKHVVKSGETLGGIAKKYEVRQADIAIMNNIQDPAKIRPGMELIIPGWQAPGGKAAKSQKSGSGSATKSTPPPPPATTVPATTTPAPSLPAQPPVTTPPPTVPVIPIEETPAAPAPKS